MTVGGIIDWLGGLNRRQLPAEIKSESLLRIENVLRASVILKTRECSLFRLHEIDGHSVYNLHKVTGLPQQAIDKNIVDTRVRLTKLLDPRRRWKKTASPEE